ncbi:polyisoprenoid-binding protein YceI [Flavobacterium sp. PL11]|uniref:YceI family protein n=1 Tax=Flavobacterium sp. PL11 TaxID=3071717 RepID=UPI002DFCFD8B|nr:polyisoprenoid-binding protein YceI [Flavobacterium sp. PL11]
MNKITFVMFLLFNVATQAQEKLSSSSGITSFEASIPLFEEVKADNKKTKGTLIVKNGHIVFSLHINDFEFKRNLMKEHFNSNYLESNRYPKATFKGDIENFDIKTIKQNRTVYNIKGKITIKGKSKNIAIKATLQKTKNGIEFISEFPLNTDDFQIEIPFVVRSKISKTVNTRVLCFLQ